MTVTRITAQPSQGNNAQDQTWRYYNEIMEKFRKLCHGDGELFKQAEARIMAKKVTAEWERSDKKTVDVFLISQKMNECVLDEEEQKAVDTLYRRKQAFRDKMCVVLGKGADEGWDSFYGRCSARKTTPNTVRQFELMSKP